MRRTQDWGHGMTSVMAGDIRKVAAAAATGVAAHRESWYAKLSTKGNGEKRLKKATRLSISLAMAGFPLHHHTYRERKRGL